MSYDTINSETNNVMIRGHSSENDALLVHNSRPASVGSINDRPLFGESRRVRYLKTDLTPTHFRFRKKYCPMD